MLPRDIVDCFHKSEWRLKGTYQNATVPLNPRCNTWGRAAGELLHTQLPSNNRVQCKNAGVPSPMIAALILLWFKRGCLCCGCGQDLTIALGPNPQMIVILQCTPPPLCKWSRHGPNQRQLRSEEDPVLRGNLTENGSKTVRSIFKGFW